MSATDAPIPEWLSLDDDEEIVWIGEPSTISVVRTVIWGVALLVVLIGALLLLAAPFSYLSIKNTDYVITNKAIYAKTGILSTNIESVRLEKIQNTEYSQSFWGKQFDYGTIDISTAGSSGAEITLKSIGDAREVREIITQWNNISSDRGDRSGAVSSGDAERSPDRAATSGAIDGDQMDELLSELRATREAMENVHRALRERTQSDTDVEKPGE